MYADSVPSVRPRARSGSTSRLRASVRSAAARLCSEHRRTAPVDLGPAGRDRRAGQRAARRRRASAASSSACSPTATCTSSSCPPARTARSIRSRRPTATAPAEPARASARSGWSSSASAVLAACRPVTSASRSRTSPYSRAFSMAIARWLASSSITSRSWALKTRDASSGHHTKHAHQLALPPDRHRHARLDMRRPPGNGCGTLAE